MACTEAIKREMEPLLREMERYAEAHYVPILRARERRIFCETVMEACPHRILELGTGIGYSTLVQAMLGAEDVRIVTVEINEARMEAAKDFIGRSPYRDCIEMHFGDAGELLSSLGGTFDFVFMDAAKGQYANYFRLFQPLLAEQAVIAADNVLFHGYVQAKGKIPHKRRSMVQHLREYIEMITHMEGYETVIREDGDGMAITRRVGHEHEKA